MTSSLADSPWRRSPVFPCSLLHVQSIPAGFGDLVAVSDVSVQVSPGESWSPSSDATGRRKVDHVARHRGHAGGSFRCGPSRWQQRDVVARRAQNNPGHELRAGGHAGSSGGARSSRTLRLGTYPLWLSRAVLQAETGRYSSSVFPCSRRTSNIRAHQLSGGPAAASRHRAGTDGRAARAAPGRAFGWTVTGHVQLVIEVVD